MGLFSGIKSTYKKSEAAVVVQNLLEHQVKVGLFDLEPAKLATKLIEIVWDTKPDVFNGKFGQRPHKIIVAASALANGITFFDDEDLKRNALVLSLGNILSEIETNGRLYPFNSLDHQLLEASMSIFAEITQDFAEPPHTEETDELTQTMFEAANFRDSLDRILSSYSVQVVENNEDKLVNEVIGVSKLIAEEAVKRSNRSLAQLTDDEMYICMLIAFVSSDHISKLSQVSFELTSTIACATLAIHKSPEEIGQLTNEVIHGHTRMCGNPSELKVLLAIGNQVSQFFSTADEKYLDELAELYTLMTNNLS